jgi:hypothetical protein
MDTTEKTKVVDREFAVALAKLCASIRGSAVQLRPSAKSESYADWIMEVSGIGRVYFKSDPKTDIGTTDVQRFEFKKRAPRKRSDNGEGISSSGSAIQPTQS